MIEINLYQNELAAEGNLGVSSSSFNISEDQASGLFTEVSGESILSNRKILIPAVAVIASLLAVVITLMVTPSSTEKVIYTEPSVPDYVVETTTAQPAENVPLAVPSEQINGITLNEASVVEEIVMGVRQKIEKKKKYVPPPLLDFEKIHSQKLLMLSTLQNIYKASPVKITFGKVVVKIPGYYYLHGLASDKKSYIDFVKQLRLSSSRLQEQPVKDVGIIGDTKEFTVYGSVPDVPLSEKKMTFINSKDLNKIRRRLIDKAENSDLSVVSFKPFKPQKLKKYTSYTYDFKMVSKYRDLMGFISDLHLEKYSGGILQLMIVPNKSEQLETTFKLVYYSKNQG